jgi:hypothetical protein
MDAKAQELALLAALSLFFAGFAWILGYVVLGSVLFALAVATGLGAAYRPWPSDMGQLILKRATAPPVRPLERGRLRRALRGRGGRSHHEGDRSARRCAVGLWPGPDLRWVVLRCRVAQRKPRRGRRGFAAPPEGATVVEGPSTKCNRSPCVPKRKSPARGGAKDSRVGLASYRAVATMRAMRHADASHQQTIAPRLRCFWRSGNIHVGCFSV